MHTKIRILALLSLCVMAVVGGNAGAIEMHDGRYDSAERKRSSQADGTAKLTAGSGPRFGLKIDESGSRHVIDDRDSLRNPFLGRQQK